MPSVSTAFKVHYNQKLGDPFGHLEGGTHHGFFGGGIDAPAYSKRYIHTLPIGMRG